MDRPFFEASAPGRLDVMGGIADYSGSLVLQMPIRETTHVRMALRDDYRCNLESEIKGERLTASIDYRDLLKDGAVDFDFAREYFHKNKSIGWTAYVLGCVLILEQTYKIGFRGADWRITSDVPLGKGVSSSAALEVATLKALGHAFEISFEGTTLPRLGQMAENLVVGAPCGLMDQLASCFGEPGKLLPIVCQPDKTGHPISIPRDISFVGIDSGIRHAVSDSSYTDVRSAAFMGYTIIARALGVTERQLEISLRTGDRTGLPYDGYLSNIPASEFEKRFKSLLPETLSGEQFLAQYKFIIDPVTRIQPGTHYSVRQCTSHPVYENHRVQQFMESLTDASADSTVRKMGELMYESHASYSRCGLGSDRTDEMVELAKGWSDRGILGAKITGGGSGGTVCLLTSGPEGRDAARDFHRHFVGRFGERLGFFEG